jgi:flagellar basal body-associated protein FliL
MDELIALLEQAVELAYEQGLDALAQQLTDNINTLLVDEE